MMLGEAARALDDALREDGSDDPLIDIGLELAPIRCQPRVREHGFPALEFAQQDVEPAVPAQFADHTAVGLDGELRLMRVRRPIEMPVDPPQAPRDGFGFLMRRAIVQRRLVRAPHDRRPGDQSISRSWTFLRPARQLPHPRVDARVIERPGHPLLHILERDLAVQRRRQKGVDRFRILPMKIFILSQQEREQVRKGAGQQEGSYLIFAEHPRRLIFLLLFSRDHEVKDEAQLQTVDAGLLDLLLQFRQGGLGIGLKAKDLEELLHPLARQTIGEQQLADSQHMQHPGHEHGVRGARQFAPLIEERLPLDADDQGRPVAQGLHQEIQDTFSDLQSRRVPLFV